LLVNSPSNNFTFNERSHLRTIIKQAKSFVGCVDEFKRGWDGDPDVISHNNNGTVTIPEDDSVFTLGPKLYIGKIQKDAIYACLISQLRQVLSPTQDDSLNQTNIENFKATLKILSERMTPSLWQKFSSITCALTLTTACVLGACFAAYNALAFTIAFSGAGDVAGIAISTFSTAILSLGSYMFGWLSHGLGKRLTNVYANKTSRLEQQITDPLSQYALLNSINQHEISRDSNQNILTTENFISKILFDCAYWKNKEDPGMEKLQIVMRDEVSSGEKYSKLRRIAIDQLNLCRGMAYLMFGHTSRDTMVDRLYYLLAKKKNFEEIKNSSEFKILSEDWDRFNRECYGPRNSGSLV
jgi:hypothetical protein